MDEEIEEEPTAEPDAHSGVSPKGRSPKGKKKPKASAPKLKATVARTVKESIKETTAGVVTSGRLQSETAVQQGATTVPTTGIGADPIFDDDDKTRAPFSAMSQVFKSKTFVPAPQVMNTTGPARVTKIPGGTITKAPEGTQLTRVMPETQFGKSALPPQATKVTRSPKKAATPPKATQNVTPKTKMQDQGAYISFMPEPQKTTSPKRLPKRSRVQDASIGPVTSFRQETG